MIAGRSMDPPSSHPRSLGHPPRPCARAEWGGATVVPLLSHPRVFDQDVTPPGARRAHALATTRLWLHRSSTLCALEGEKTVSSLGRDRSDGGGRSRKRSRATRGPEPLAVDPPAVRA